MKGSSVQFDKDEKVLDTSFLSRAKKVNTHHEAVDFSPVRRLIHRSSSLGGSVKSTFAYF